MSRYTHKIPNSVIYSIGDTHGCGGEIIDFITRLELRSCRRGESHPAFVQLGDLCDGFSYPQDQSNENFRRLSLERIESMPELKSVLFREGNHFVDWDKDEGVRAQMTGEELMQSEDHEVVVAVYEAFKCFETLMMYSRFQKRHPNDFYVVLGNHDADLLRGGCAYGRKQKYILLGLLGLSPDAVIAHMTEGRTKRLMRNPWVKWLSERPHILMGRDTVYMHGGPTGELSERLSQTGAEGFEKWIEEMDEARTHGWNDPAFTEHESFLSPDGAPNDWLKHPDCILNFLKAADRKYLAVGHSPFLDYEKGPMLDLANASHEMKKQFATPAQLPPEGRLIKHDTNMKRVGELWACRHEVGTDIWTGIDADLNEFPLRSN